MISDSNLFVAWHPKHGLLIAQRKWPGFEARYRGPTPDPETWVSFTGDAREASTYAADLWGEETIFISSWDPLVKIPAPICAVCGVRGYHWAPLNLVTPHADPAKRSYRCYRHAEVNPCAVEGCERKRQAKGHFSTEVFLCSTHYRMACPPGSPPRRIVNRLFRTAKKHGGWSRELETRYWRIWAALLKRARSMTAGDIDMDEINKLFGWDRP